MTYNVLSGALSLYTTTTSVCLSDDNFRKPSRRTFTFAHPLYLQAIRVMFVYKGHRVKIKVTRAKKVDTAAYSRNEKLRWTTIQFDPRRLKIPSQITPLL